MLTITQREVMNTPLFRGNKCVGYSRYVLRDEVVELVLGEVHPNNLGALPPSPEVIAYKAMQIGLIATFAEAFCKRRTGQFN